MIFIDAINGEIMKKLNLHGGDAPNEVRRHT